MKAEIVSVLVGPDGKQGPGLLIHAESMAEYFAMMTIIYGGLHLLNHSSEARGHNFSCLIGYAE